MGIGVLVGVLVLVGVFVGVDVLVAVEVKVAMMNPVFLSIGVEDGLMTDLGSTLDGMIFKVPGKLCRVDVELEIFTAGWERWRW